jgi:hypothetical protein
LKNHKGDVRKYCANYDAGYKCLGCIISRTGEMIIDSKLAGKKCLIAQGKDCQYFDKVVVPGIINE